MFSGSLVALITPFSEGQVDYETLEEYLDTERYYDKKDFSIYLEQSLLPLIRIVKYYDSLVNRRLSEEGSLGRVLSVFEGGREYTPKEIYSRNVIELFPKESQEKYREEILKSLEVIPLIRREIKMKRKNGEEFIDLEAKLSQSGMDWIFDYLVGRVYIFDNYLIYQIIPNK